MTAPGPDLTALAVSCDRARARIESDAWTAEHLAKFARCLSGLIDKSGVEVDSVALVVTLTKGPWRAHAVVGASPSPLDLEEVGDEFYRRAADAMDPPGAPE